MKKILLLIMIFCSLNGMSQKKKKFSLGEKLGDLTGNLLTGKTSDLSLTSVKVGMICGIYPTELGTSESKYFPAWVQEGDYCVYVSFLKQEGVGMLQILGDVTLDGEPMEYAGMGSYGKYFKIPPKKPLTLAVKTETGDEASFSVTAIPGVEIISINGETSLPVLDLDEDIELEYYNPPGSEGTRIRVSMLTDAVGVRALNHFADFPVTKTGNVKVTIPKESLANPEIAGQLNVGNFNKGENWLIVEREKITASSDYGSDQNPGNVGSSELKTVSYATMPIIVKGKQDDGLLVSMKVTGKSEDKMLGYEFHKPSAQTGIPVSKASKFGLVSFTMTANTFKQETETTSSSWTVGNTRYTQTTIKTTTWEFPQLPKEHWDYVQDVIYKDMVAFFKSEYDIDFVPVEDVTGTSQYADLYPTDQELTKTVVKQSYKGTQRSTPQKASEIWNSLSSNMTSDNPTVNMMKEAGEVDGLMSLNFNLQVASDANDKIILIPRMSISITGRDETNNSKLGKYLDGVVIRNTGEPFNSELLMTSKDELLRVCSHKQMIQAMKAGITTLREKEIELGYDKIWSIGE